MEWQGHNRGQRMSRKLNKSRPQIACEISAQAVVAARASQHGQALDVYTAKELPRGAVAPGLIEANVLRGDWLRDTIKAAMDEVAGRNRDVVTILPDAAVRVVLLDFETLPEKREEAEAVV